METEMKLEELYLDLLKKAVTRSMAEDHFRRIPYNDKTPLRRARSLVLGAIERALTPFKLALVHNCARDGETMIGMAGLDNIQRCWDQVFRDRVPGDLMETGVWRGGACIFMRALLRAYGDADRKVWVADSFEGLPKPDEVNYPADKGDPLWTYSLAVSLEEVKRNFEKYEMLDERVHFLKGWFKDTIRTAPIERLAILRLDGDMYESTIQVLDALYGKVSPGGFVIVDDYGMVKQCDEAVHDFRRTHGITETMLPVDGRVGVYWRKAN